MQVKFLKQVLTAIGPFEADSVHVIEDDHTRDSWIASGFCELVKEPEVKPVEPEPKKPRKPRSGDRNEN
jgi:hypothetical protein